MKLSSGKPVHNPNLPPRTATGRPAQMPRPPAERPTYTPPGGAVARTRAVLPSGSDKGRPVVERAGMTAPKPHAPTGPHITEEIRGDLGKLTPSLAAGIRAVADRK
jgi:hypothetical protein